MKNRVLLISLAVMLALGVGLIGCGGESVPECSLTISTTEGGEVTAPGEGTHTYDEGAVVELVATPAACYRFVNWIGNVSTIADPNDATTTITMSTDCSIIAEFGEEEALALVDSHLETVIRGAIGRTTGSICPSDLGGLMSLDAGAKGITDLTGLEYTTSLAYLMLGDNRISDISPLADLTSLIVLNLRHNQLSDISHLTNLTSLIELRLDSNPGISDISPLADLTNLTQLYLGDTQTSDISPLADLTSLTTLWLYGNQISDISPLVSLTNLAILSLEDNQISDISPLANLGSLTDLDLRYNQIIDISPLVDNEGLSEGDEVHLGNNPLSSDSINIYIPQLEARGVIVYY